MNRSKAHVDIDNAQSAGLIPFAQKQIDKLKKVLPFGKRRWNLATGEEITVWWGGIYDKIKIISGMLGRAIPDRTLLIDPTPMFRVSGDQIIETREISHTTGLFNFGVGNWSKNNVTFVSVPSYWSGFFIPNDNLQTATIIREGVTVLVPNIRAVGGIPSQVLGLPFSTTSAFVPDIRPELGATRDSFDTITSLKFAPTDMRISSDGNRVTFRSTKPNELFKVAQWNVDAKTFDVSTIGYPPRYVELLNAALSAGAVQILQTDDKPEGSLRNDALISSIGGTDLTPVVPIGWYPIVPLYTTKKLVLAFQVGVHTSALNIASGIVGSSPVSLWRLSGTITTAVMEYDIDSGVWSSLLERTDPLVFLNYLVGSTSFFLTSSVIPVDFGVAPAPNYVITCDLTGVISVHEYVTRTAFDYSPVTISKLIINSTPPQTVALETSPSTEQLIPCPFFINGLLVATETRTDVLGATPVQLATGIVTGSTPSSVMVSGGTRIGWRWGSNDSQQLDIVDSSGATPEVYMSPSGLWLFVIPNGFNSLQVYFEGVLVWDASTQVPLPTISTVAMPSTSRDGVVISQDFLGTSRTNQFVSFSPDDNGVYQINRLQKLPKLFHRIPGDIAIPLEILPDECVRKIA